jgi:Phosphotransferase enzyme family
MLSRGSMPTRVGAEPKQPWRAVPSAVRRRVEDLVGQPVARAVRAWGGYAPSPTFRLLLADGRRVFFKGVDPTSNEHMHRALEAEERVYVELEPWLAGCAPALYASFRQAGWHVLLLEDLGPARIPPWTRRAVEQTMHGYAAFHGRSLELARPIPDWVSRTRHHAFASTWRRLAAEPGGLDGVASLAGPRADEALDWLRVWLPRLQESGEALVEVGPPHVLLHLDTRSDNLRLQPGGRLRLFDWPYACLGPPEFDVAAFVQSLSEESGVDPESLVARYAATLPVRDSALDAGLAAVAGYFASNAWREPIPGLPRLRGVQRRQLVSSLSWAARRLGLPHPAWLTAVSP